MAIALLLGTLIGAWNIDQVERRHIEFGVIGGRVIVYGFFVLAILSLLCGIMGIAKAVRRRQPFGLSIAGTLLAVVAIACASVMIGVGEYVVADTHRLFAQHTRFQPANAELIEEVKSAVAENPNLKTYWDWAMNDGMVSVYEANDILVRAGRRVRVTSPVLK